MLGLNAFEAYSTVVLVGRLQPPVGSVEDTARCIFGDDGGGLRGLDGASFVTAETLREMQDGALVTARVQDHPDRRVRRILHQLREAQSLQAVARLRLTAPDRPKRVVVLGNLPLPGLPVSRLTTLAALAAGLEDEPDVPGHQRLSAALGEGERPEVAGLRLSAHGLKADAPRAFPTIGAARRFRRERDADAVRALLHRLATRRDWPVTFLLLDAPGGGRPVPAVVLARKSAALAVAQRLWPERTSRLWS
jgi:hypothetical protein